MVTITAEKSLICMILVVKTVFTSDDIAMLGHGCSVSQYPQFYHRHLENN